MPRPIAFDLCRLFFAAVGSTPRGIDRMDLGFAHRLFGDPGRRDLGVVPTLSGMGTVGPAEALRIAAVVETHWRETAPAESDERAATLHRWLAAGRTVPGPPAGPLPVRISPGLPHRYAAMIAPARWSGLRRAVRVVPERAVYLNTGQVLLGWPFFFRWLDQRPDVRPVFMIHDLIPIRFPEYAGPFLARAHTRALRLAARRGAALLASSHAVADELRQGLAALGRRDMPIHVTPLPVSPSLLGAGSAAPADPPYFVTVGIVDQRKNHRMLLHVWRDLIRAQGGPVPKLVIAGARGVRTGSLAALVDRSPGLAGAVTIASGLSSPAMRDIIAGARALLMPSFTEGFGLPIVEAQALGVPVVASDIPAHREVGGPETTYLDPLDGLAWRREILTRAAVGTSARTAPRDGPGVGGPQTWDAYFADILPFLESL